MIFMNNISVIKGDSTILSDISLTLSEKRIGIIGDNGSGKSTFAKLLNGLQPCSTGHIGCGDTSSAADKQMRSFVGFVFQNPDNQIVYPLVEEDIAFGLKKSGLTKTEVGARVDEYLVKFSLTHLRGRFTHELSGGEKQLIALVGVLIMLPQYIVLDEPTTLLDLRNRAMLLKVLSELEQSLVIVSHDLEWMMKMDRVILIHNGKIHLDGHPESVIPQYKRLAEC